MAHNNIQVGHRWEQFHVFVTGVIRSRMKELHCWEVLLCLNMKKKHTEKHKAIDSPPGGICYLLMTAASADAQQRAASQPENMNMVPYV